VARLETDPSVSSVRLAREFRIASETVPSGIKRVKAWTSGSTPGPDVNANVAVIDTGIGPANDKGVPIAMTPIGAEELNIRGGVNCYDSDATVDPKDLADYRDWWGDTNGHGTHVAGTIGARDNSVGAVGVAPGAKLWSVRVFKGAVGSEAAVICGLDWAVATHSNETPDIDVINMSIEGGRVDYREDCQTILGLPASRGDGMQKAVCRAIQEGIVVVAAAGNGGINANESAPGGYDQVISVAAMTDTDGVGWEKGPNAGCDAYYGGEKDDTFASYSNHGADVDIVAPGTCVYSTDYLDKTGDTLVAMTGTSMAAPHVTGAVARYIAAKGNPSSVGYMRQLIRAAGRMDWDPKTDPVWFGVNDTDPPNRVLDVAALTGGPAIKAFVYHDAFKVGGSQTSRTTRVDVQRSGGYDKAVDLTVQGLPAAAGTASYDDPTLNGLAPHKLGTNLDLKLDASGGEGVHALQIDATGLGVAASDPRVLTLIIDRTGPKVSGLAPKIRGGKVAMTAKGKAQVYLQWTDSDALSEVKSAQLQRKTGTAAWKNAGVPGDSSARVFLKAGQNNKFRVKAKDTIGNMRTSGAVSGRLSVRDSGSSQWSQTGSWKTKQAKKAFRGSILLATSGSAGLQTSFTGKAAAIAASVGPGRGTFRVRVDGGAWTTVDTKSSSAGHRKVVWTSRLPYGSHAVEIQRVSGQTAVDALLIVR
jgi:subtilisin family serine protease